MGELCAARFGHGHHDRGVYQWPPSAYDCPQLSFLLSYTQAQLVAATTKSRARRVFSSPRAAQAAALAAFGSSDTYDLVHKMLVKTDSGCAK